MAQRGALYLKGGYFFATAVDDLFQAAFEKQKTIRIQAPKIPTAKPVLKELRAGFNALVPPENGWPLDTDFSGLTNGQGRALCVADCDRRPGHLPDAVGFTRGWW
jgi:hypothetical protein